MKTKLVLFIIKNKKLALLGLTYLSFLSLFYLVEPVRKLIFQENSQTLRENIVFLAIVLNLIILFLAYLIFFKRIKEISFKNLFILSVIINLFLWLIWPIAATDIFCYLYQGRILAIFKQSPYLATYQNFSSDIFFNFLKNSWSNYISPYGPIFNLLSAFFAFIFKKNIIITLWSLKLFFILINIINGYLIYKISSQKISFFLYAFNPLILFELAINGHNDSVFIFFVLIALFLLKNLKNNKNKYQKYLQSFFFMTLSVLTKFISIIFLPILALILFLKEKNIKKRIIMTTCFILIFIITTLLSYYPFIEKWQNILIPINTQSQIKGIFLSPLIIFFFKILNFFSNYPLETSIIIGRIFFIIVYLYLIFAIIKNRNKISTNYQPKIHIFLGITLLILLLSSFTWLMPWYFTLLITLFAIIFSSSQKNKFLSLLIIFGSTFYGIIYYLILR